MSTPYYSDDLVTLYLGDCIDVLAGLPANSVDAVVTDPPYSLAFMSREWDTHATPAAFQQWCELWATECLRVLKPGGHLLSFGGTRTWHRLVCAIEDAGFEIRDSIAWLYGSGFPKSLDVSKALDKAAGAEREVVGTRPQFPDGTRGARARPNASPGVYSDRPGLSGEILVTAPATEAAQQWQGWGTALKPAWEVVVSACKPFSDKDFQSRIGSWLAQAMDPTTPIGAAVASNDQTATSPSGSATTMNSNTVTSWLNCWAELSEATSTFTTETGSRTTTDLRTLWSCLAQITPESITQDPTSQPGQSSLVQLAENLFAVAVLNSRVTRALTATGTATRPTRPTFPEGAAPAFEPIVVARKPLVGTVAVNVLAHGTGALNIDGCRIAHASAADRAESAGKNQHTRYANPGSNRDSYSGSMPPRQDYDASRGRWPANVVLDESQAAALDAQSGDQRDGTAVNRNRDGQDLRSWYGTRNSQVGEDVGYGSGGGASRFFYTPKADSNERITHNGTAHPTVKPLSLMRYLVRLVTPPGGVCLDPFAGSGTTVEACILEGFRCIAIEREADYLPLITQRINRRRDPIAYITAAGEDLGLFGSDDAA